MSQCHKELGELKSTLALDLIKCMIFILSINAKNKTEMYSKSRFAKLYETFEKK